MLRHLYTLLRHARKIDIRTPTPTSIDLSLSTVPFDYHGLKDEKIELTMPNYKDQPSGGGTWPANSHESCQDIRCGYHRHSHIDPC